MGVYWLGEFVDHFGSTKITRKCISFSINLSEVEAGHFLVLSHDTELD
jgi:hypothetical protein